MRRILSVVAALMTLAFFTGPALAQDPVKVDPKHYKVEFENDHVRVLRVTVGPREESVMHEHPANVVVFLSDAQIRFTLPDGTTHEATGAKGGVQYDAGGKHQGVNLTDKSIEVIVVELKGGSGGH